MDQQLIDQNIERVKVSTPAQLITGGIQMFMSRLPLIAGVLGLINLPIALYYGLYGAQMVLPFELTDAGEMIYNEALVPLFYQQRLIDLGVELYALVGVLAVAYIVELSIHGEIPQFDSILSHVMQRWFAGMRTGVVKGALMLLIWVLASLLGVAVMLGLSLVLPTEVAMVAAIVAILAFAALPFLMVAAFFYYDMYATSLRDVAGWRALVYSFRISRKRWFYMLRVLLMVLVTVEFPLYFFQMGAALVNVDAIPLFDVVIILFFRVLAGLPLTIYTLFFLKFDYLNTEEEKDAVAIPDEPVA